MPKYTYTLEDLARALEHGRQVQLRVAGHDATEDEILEYFNATIPGIQHIQDVMKAEGNYPLTPLERVRDELTGRFEKPVHGQVEVVDGVRYQFCYLFWEEERHE